MKSLTLLVMLVACQAQKKAHRLADNLFCQMQADLEMLAGPEEKKSYMMQLGEVFDVDAEMVEDVELLILHHAADCPRPDPKPGSKPGNGSAPAWAVKLAKSFVAVATVAGVMI